VSVSVAATTKSEYMILYLATMKKLQKIMQHLEATTALTFAAVERFCCLVPTSFISTSLPTRLDRFIYNILQTYFHCHTWNLKD
jgi:hypothetical protein